VPSDSFVHVFCSQLR